LAPTRYPAANPMMVSIVPALPYIVWPLHSLVSRLVGDLLHFA
jgi:hypothetical protein